MDRFVVGVDVIHGSNHSDDDLFAVVLRIARSWVSDDLGNIDMTAQTTTLAAGCCRDTAVVVQRGIELEKRICRLRGILALDTPLKRTRRLVGRHRKLRMPGVNVVTDQNAPIGGQKNRHRVYDFDTILRVSRNGLLDVPVYIPDPLKETRPSRTAGHEQCRGRGCKECKGQHAGYETIIDVLKHWTSHIPHVSAE